MKWLVTGGAGFIGSHFIDHVFATDVAAEVVCFDNFTYAANREFVNPRAPIIEGDIRDESQVTDVLCKFKPDFVVNFAAESHVDNSYAQVALFTDTNVNGTANLLQCLRAIYTHFRFPLFVQISTDEVYGDTDANVGMGARSRPLNPQNPYAASKAAAEFMVNAFSRSFGIHAMITRSSNNWGPRQNHEKFIPACLEAKATGQPMALHGYEYARDWLHVQDNVRAIYELTLKAGHGVWDISTGSQHSLKQVIERIGDVPHHLSCERPGVDVGYWVDSTDTWDLLEWRPRDFMTDYRWDEYVASESFQTEDVR